MKNESKKIKIKVDNREVDAIEGQMLIEVTDKTDVYIPRFCYHHKLSVAANCRMCLVEVKGAPKPLPACATPVADGMQVSTSSEYAINAQKANMEFLLINHPLDCPICDQGGECELQDIAMGYGRGVSRYNEGKRVVKDKDLGPLISTDMTRCIHCTRCIRFGEEIAGMQELGAIGRSDKMEIGTFVEKSINHELSGNIIDLCPVGALNNKPYRMTARAWEMEQYSGIAPHDCFGSNIYLHVLRGKVKRIVPRENERINETWLSDRDRFSFEGIYSPDRLLQPLVRVNGKLLPHSWEQALLTATDGLLKINSIDGGQALGAWVSSSSTIEEGYLAGRLMRHLGSNNIDFRLRRRDFRGQLNEPAIPLLGREIAEMENLNACLLIGSNLRKEVPLLAHRLRKAAIADGLISFINPRNYDYLFPVANYIETHSVDLCSQLTAVVIAAGGSEFKSGDTEINPQHHEIVSSLRSETSSILIGHIGQRNPAYSELWQLASRLGELTGAKVGLIPEGPNSSGLSFAGALPHLGPGGEFVKNPGADFSEMLSSPVKALIQIGVEPEFDCADSVAAIQAISDAEFNIVLSPWLTGSAKDFADVILPIGSFAETSGTFANAENCWQSFTKAVSPVGESRPGWETLTCLAKTLNAPGFDYINSESIRDELKIIQATSVANSDAVILESNSELPLSISELEIPIYSIDPLVRRAESLQQTEVAVPNWRKMA
ncbi:MAG: NADH-quinone oxidoreductase subunit NuoG [Pseudomonadota bacterium]|nr:NADH-quinone oxidoreductase subunit NuoG [Pseudomonadota bacterium]